MKEFILESRSGEIGQTTRPWGNTLPPSLGVIKVIHVASIGTSVTRRRGVLTVASAKNDREEQPSGKRTKYAWELIAFNDEDLEGITQPYDDVLVVTAGINGFIVKRVLVDQESGAELMYPDLFKGLGLKMEDLSKYNTPLVGFDGQMVVPEGQISLLVNMEGKEVMVNFIVVSSFSPYTAILGRSWIHAMGTVRPLCMLKSSFTLTMVLQQ